MVDWEHPDYLAGLEMDLLEQWVERGRPWDLLDHPQQWCGAVNCPKPDGVVRIILTG